MVDGIMGASPTRQSAAEWRRHRNGRQRRHDGASDVTVGGGAGVQTQRSAAARGRHRRDGRRQHGGATDATVGGGIGAPPPQSSAAAWQRHHRDGRRRNGGADATVGGGDMMASPTLPSAAEWRRRRIGRRRRHDGAPDVTVGDGAGAETHRLAAARGRRHAGWRWHGGATDMTVGGGMGGARRCCGQERRWPGDVGRGGVRIGTVSKETGMGMGHVMEYGPGQMAVVWLWRVVSCLEWRCLFVWRDEMKSSRHGLASSKCLCKAP